MAGIILLFLRLMTFPVVSFCHMIQTLNCPFVGHLKCRERPFVVILNIVPVPMLEIFKAYAVPTFTEFHLFKLVLSLV